MNRLLGYRWHRGTRRGSLMTCSVITLGSNLTTHRSGNRVYISTARTPPRALRTSCPPEPRRFRRKNSQFQRSILSSMFTAVGVDGRQATPERNHFQRHRNLSSSSLFHPQFAVREVSLSFTWCIRGCRGRTQPQDLLRATVTHHRFAWARATSSPVGVKPCPNEIESLPAFPS